MSLHDVPPFTNAYADAERADAYSRLAFPGTYHLAFRDLPPLLSEAPGRRGLDFGCGAGRSTRFLRDCGFEAMGVDISAAMIEKARALDPGGDYRLVGDGDLSTLDGYLYDVVLSAFTFDNVPTRELKVRISRQLAARLSPGGRIVHVVSSPELYLHDWMSFTTSVFPGNRVARPGESVWTIITDTVDARPVEDVLCPDEWYREIFTQSGLEVLAVHRPLGREDEPFAWVNETRIAPWAVWVLGARPRDLPCAPGTERGC